MKCQVLGNRQRWNEIELLKHQPDGAAPQGGEPGVVHRGDVGPVHPDLASIGRIQPGDQMQQRAFARSGFTRKRQVLPGIKLQRHALQHIDGPFLSRIGFRDIVQRQQHEGVRGWFCSYI